MFNDIQIIIFILQSLGSGLVTFVGIRVSLAEVKTELKRLDKIENRLDRLEERYFK